MESHAAANQIHIRFVRPVDFAGKEHATHHAVHHVEDGLFAVCLRAPVLLRKVRFPLHLPKYTGVRIYPNGNLFGQKAELRAVDDGGNFIIFFAVGDALYIKVLHRICVRTHCAGSTVLYYEVGKFRTESAVKGMDGAAMAFHRSIGRAGVRIDPAPGVAVVIVFNGKRI